MALLTATSAHPTIPTRRFGSTNLPMPIFTCGGMRFQQSWDDQPLDQISPQNQQKLEETIHRALQLGFRHIETARAYGTSEIQLGLALQNFPRNSFLLQTKIPPLPAEKFRQAFLNSLQKLRTTYVDLLSIHGINNQQLLDLTLQPNGALHAARQLQREGLALHIGFSTHAPLPIILKAIRSGEFSYVNLHWYWIFQENSPAIEEADKYDMGVFIISPNDKGGKLYDPPQKLRQLTHPYHPMVFNNLFCLSNPNVHTLSLGAAKPSDFDEHLNTIPLLPNARQISASIDQKLQNAAVAQVGSSWWHHYLDGIPEYEQIPGQINIRVILRLWTLYRCFDMLAYAQMRYNLLGNAGHWFPGNNAANFDDIQIQNSIPNSPFRNQIPQILREAHSLFFKAPAKRLSKD